jgi:cell wall-associated NlpC family hydrolase
MKQQAKILLFLSLFQLIFFISIIPAQAADTGMPVLSIPIPNLSFKPAVACTTAGDENKLCINWIAEYIAGIYKYAIGIVGILATVVMMIGGVMWIMSGGNASTAGEAKSWIASSLTGLIIALSSYTILYQVNPDLINVFSRPIKIQYISEYQEEADGSGAGYTSKDASMEGLNSLGVARTLQSTGAVYDQAKRGQYIDGKWHLDCSSFTQKAWVDAGLQNPGGNTEAQYNNPKAETFSLDMQSSLKAGDILVWRSGGAGHSAMCYDDGCTQRIHMPGHDKNGADRGVVTSRNTAAYLKSQNWKVIRVAKN